MSNENENTFNHPKFDFAKHICERFGYDVDAVCRTLYLYSSCYINEEDVLQVLQWLPEKHRKTIWDAYKNSNMRCDK